MSVDYSAQQPTAMWNPARGVWEIPMENILCEHWGLFSATFPTSGMMRGGKLFPLPQLGHRTVESEFSLLRTPVASEAEGGAMHPDDAKAGGNGHGASLSIEVQKLLPTPLTTEANHGDYESEWNRNSPPLGTMVHSDEWGKFAPAIHQWETITKNPAPPPTIPDGRDGQARLNPQFAEWMMGLPPGWITNCNITRNEQLKACGNGVVPQQATLAITRLLQGITL